MILLLFGHNWSYQLASNQKLHKYKAVLIELKKIFC